MRVAEAFAADAGLLEANGYAIGVDLNQPGYIRAIVRQGNQATEVEGARDSTWRFVPTVRDDRVGFVLHPVDLAVNKVLALAGRDETRDVLDALHLHEHVLGLGILCWAACGKDRFYPALPAGTPAKTREDPRGGPRAARSRRARRPPRVETGVARGARLGGS